MLLVPLLLEDYNEGNRQSNISNYFMMTHVGKGKGFVGNAFLFGTFSLHFYNTYYQKKEGEKGLGIEKNI
jgi:hypothetical protein